MNRLVLSDEQARLLSLSKEVVEVVDQDGKHLGYVTTDFSAEEIAEAERRAGSDGPWYTTDEVLKHLKSLERA
jgi:hypothetical protein